MAEVGRPYGAGVSKKAYFERYQHLNKSHSCKFLAATEGTSNVRMSVCSVYPCHYVKKCLYLPTLYLSLTYLFCNLEPSF